MGAEARAKRERRRLIERYELGKHAGREELELVLAIVGAFDRDPGLAGITNAVRAVYRRYDDTAARLPMEHVDGRVRLKLACTPGCAHCCAAPVTVIAPEAALIAEHVRETFSEEQRARLLARIERHMHATDDPDERWPMCPLNVDGLCSVYPVRPFNCRKFHSFDLAACHEYFVADDEPGPGAIIPRDVTRDGGVFWDGLDAGFTALKTDTRDLELVPALRIALTTDVSFDQLRAGDDTFAAARYAP